MRFYGAVLAFKDIPALMRRLRSVLFHLLGLLLICSALHGQEQRNAPVPLSDLGQENLARVAAPAAQIEQVLRKEPGLMVELKRWAARDAADHGQILNDSDLSDQAILDRLATDSEFRSIATRLLQRYGYLIPKVNADSDLAKEQDLVLKERAIQLAKAEEDERTGKQSSGEKPFERAKACDPARDTACLCDPQTDPNCAQTEQRPSPRRTQRASPLTTAPFPETNFPEPNEGTFPLLLPGAPVQRTEAQGLQLQQAGAGREEGAALRTQVMPNPASPYSNELNSGLPAGPLPRGAQANELAMASSPEAERESNPRAHPLSRRGTEEKATLESAAMLRRPNPYADIPSLYDMYMQAAPRPPQLERFGMDVFRDGTRDSQYLPMDLPVGPDYVVGPGDGLTIDMWGGISQRIFRSVDREGRVALPEAGPVLVSGRTLGEVQQSVQQILRTQFRDVSADVSLSRLRTIRVYVVGDVEHPGAYDISSLSTPLNALFEAGGPTERGSLRLLRHYRGKQVVEDVDVYDLLLHGVRSGLERLDNGDTVLVPPIGSRITVEGMVRRPAVYELRGEKSLAEVLELAGGILPAATLRHIEVQRLVAHEKRTMLSLDIPEEQDADSIRKQLESFAIQDGDDVRIFPIAPYNQDAVYLEGHVLRPGRYSYRQGMKLTEIVSSYKDLLPEPAGKYAEIIRLNPPDFHPSVESFDLGAALANPAAAPALNPLDTVRIYSRFDFQNPPTVSVIGDVRAPGTYRTSGQIHLRDAIELAGGLLPDANLEDAQVFEFLPDSKLKISSVDLGEALAGNPLDNVLLGPRDRIIVHRNPAKADPATVSIQGEVVRPGRYPLTTNLKAADLIRLAGGLKRSADTGTADLTRYIMGGKKQDVGEHLELNIASALAGDPDFSIPLRDGDVLTIRQKAYWNDIGASVTVRGEVQHPGVYGIRPGERLSSVLKRAGGFLPTAYPMGGVLERSDVRQLQEKSRAELIERIQQDSSNVRVAASEGAQERAAILQASMEQHQRAVENLRQMPITGRLVIRLRSDLTEFEKSPDNIEVRSGDVLYIPKRPEFVVVTGQVYNSDAITYRPQKSASWYLRQAGGPTDLANKKAIFIIRANGSVVSGKGEGWWGGNVLSTVLQPGDTIVVPEKPVGGSQAWKNLLSVAQLAQAAAMSAFIVTR